MNTHLKNMRMETNGNTLQRILSLILASTLIASFFAFNIAAAQSQQTIENDRYLVAVTNVAKTEKSIEDLKAQREKIVIDYNKLIKNEQEKITTNTPYKERTDIETSIEQLREKKTDLVQKITSQINEKMTLLINEAQTTFTKAQSAYNTENVKLKELEAEKQAILTNDKLTTTQRQQQLAAKEKEIAKQQEIVNKKQTEMDLAEKNLEAAKKKYKDNFVDNEEAINPQDLKNSNPDTKDSNTDPSLGTVDRADSLESFDVSTYLTVPGQNTSYFDETKQSGIIQFIISIINLLIRIIGAVGMIVVIIGGIVLMTSGGTEQQLEQGKNILKYGIIGIVVALASFLIITFVNNFLSV